MNTAIAEIYRNAIKDLSFVDQNSLAGLVRRLEVSGSDAAGKSIKNYYPIGCTLTAEDCRDVNKYTYLTPDAKKRSVIFFEDRGVTYLERVRDSHRWRSSMVLVCWMNTKFFQGAGCYSSAPVFIQLQQAICGPGLFNYNFGGGFSIQNIRPKVRVQFQKDVNIFSRYSFKESVTQFLLHPFDYLSFLIETEFDTNKNCTPDITIIDPTCNP